MTAEVTFLASPPGLGDQREFELEPLDEQGLLFALRSTSGAGSRLFLLQPGPYFPDYAPQIAQDDMRALGLDADPQSTAVLVVVHPGDERSPTTANLLAPVVLNTTTRQALQPVLDDAWPLRAPLTEG